MSYSKQGDKIAQGWLLKIMGAAVGSKMLIPNDGYSTKEEAQTMKWKLYNERKIYERSIDPIEAQTVRISLKYVEGRFYLKLEKHDSPPLSGFMIAPDGTKSLISIEDETRTRIISKMIEDGMTLEQVYDLMGELSGEEEAMFHNDNPKETSPEE